MGGIFEEMFRPLRRYADFRGRAARKEYWLFLLFTALVLGAIVAGGIAAGWNPIVNDRLELVPEIRDTPVKQGVFWAMMGYVAVLGIPFFAVQVRRFHDRGLSAWMLLWNIVPYVGTFVIVVVTLLRGTPGDNRYGRDPTDTLDEWGFMIDPKGTPKDDRWR